MDLVTMSAGLLPIGYGLFTFWARANRPSLVAKLEPMKEQWGEGPGTALHVAAYSILPIVLGAIVVWAGSNGASLADLLAS